MKLVVITAIVAVCGAAKLDRTYLPPASAKTAGGSPGALQAPFAGNSLNNGLGGLPKGSYENDFQGVVVDAAAAGTRASEPGETGLGAPRISYGSTNSKVGAAAFKTRPSAFVAAQSDETEQGFQSQGSFPTGTNAGFQQGSNSNTEDANAAFQQGSFPNPGAQNSAFQQQQQQSFSNSERPRASLDRSATILRYENEVGPENYHFAFETDNGISAEENGVATNGVQAQGGFSYTGDDGQVYSVSYTADENGYQPKGDHLPTPPPIPEEILKSLEQNARDEAAGLSDDGSYDAQRYNAGSDYAESEDANGKYTHQSSKFGSAETDTHTFNHNQGTRQLVAGQSSFNGQAGQVSNANGQTSNRYTQGGSGSSLNLASDGQGFKAQSEHSSSVSAGHSSNVLTGQSEQSGLELVDDDSASEQGQFGQNSAGSQSQTNGFGSFSGASTVSGSKQSQSRPSLGNRNEYLPPLSSPQSGRPQNGNPQSGRPQAGRPQAFTASSHVSQSSDESSNDKDSSVEAIPLGQQDLQDERRPQQALTSFGKPISTGVTSQNGFSPSNTQARPSNGRRTSSSGNLIAQGQSSQTGRPNEYLPPSVSSPSRRPNRPQYGNTFSAQLNQQNEQDNVDSNIQSQGQTQEFSASSAPESQSTFSSQSAFGSQSQQLNGFQKPQSSRPKQNGNRFPSQAQTSLNSPSGQSSFGLNSQKATVQPATELTTPFESTNDESASLSGSQIIAGNFVSSGRPTQASFASQYNNNQNTFSAQPARPHSSRPLSPRPFGQTQTQAFPSQSPSSSIGQFNQNAQLVNQPQVQSTFDQNDDVQYASSTVRPSFTGQPQGPDDSYYYNQPSKPFGTPQASRFPSAPSNQFDRVTQQLQFGQNQLSGSQQNVPSAAFPTGQYQGSTKYPRPPVIRPTQSSAPTSQIQGQFGNNYRKPSTRYPQLPTPAPASPTASAQSQYQSNSVNGVTQASISPFPSQNPTQASQSQFGSRPSFQQQQYNQALQSASSSFTQQPTQPSFGQQSTASASFSRRPSGSASFQSQATFGQSETQHQASHGENEPSVPSQQYTGEIYEYNKPAMTLPPPDSTPATSMSQFGQKMPSKFGQSQSQFGQTKDEEDQRPISQFGSQPPIAPSRPFGAQSKPQVQNFGAQAEQTEEDMKPFGALAQSQAMFGSQSSQQTRPQFGQSRPQFGQSTFGHSENTQKLQDDKPQFDAQPEPESEQSADVLQSQGPKNQFGFVSACCKDNASRKPDKPQFGDQTSFTGSQKQPTNSFAGKGEEFGGPRPPPSFDEETGYHY